MKGLHSHYPNKIISFSKSNSLCVGRTSKHVSPQKQLLTVSFNVIVGLLKYKYDFQRYIYIFFSLGFHVAENVHPSEDVTLWSSPTSSSANKHNIAAKGWNPLQ